jgi:fatty-acyl-CoA synthase
VIGVADDNYAEAVHAIVVIEPGARVSEEELRSLVQTELNALYIPREVEFVVELPLTPLAKVDKKMLRERFAAARREVAGAASS